jgi:hypothetical protein
VHVEDLQLRIYCVETFWTLYIKWDFTKNSKAINTKRNIDNIFSTSSALPCHRIHLFNKFGGLRWSSDGRVSSVISTHTPWLIHPSPTRASIPQAIYRGALILILTEWRRFSARVSRTLCHSISQCLALNFKPNNYKLSLFELKWHIIKIRKRTYCTVLDNRATDAFCSRSDISIDCYGKIIFCLCGFTHLRLFGAQRSRKSRGTYLYFHSN